MTGLRPASTHMRGGRRSWIQFNFQAHKICGTDLCARYCAISNYKNNGTPWPLWELLVSGDRLLLVYLYFRFVPFRIFWAGLWRQLVQSWVNMQEKWNIRYSMLFFYNITLFLYKNSFIRTMRLKMAKKKKKNSLRTGLRLRVFFFILFFISTLTTLTKYICPGA